MNFSTVKALSIPEGASAKIESNSTVIWELPVSYTNQVPISIDTDGSIYNDCGYMNGYRLSSSGVTKAHDYSTVTGYISAVGGDIIRIGGIPWHNNAEINYLCAYDSSFNYIGGIYGISGKYYTTQIHSAYEVSDELSTITLADLSDIAYIRVSCHNTQVPDGANMIVTVNEEIV